MTLKNILVDIGKLFLCGIAFVVGTFIGGIVAVMLGLALAKIPTGMDRNVVWYQMLTTPLIALALTVLSRGLGGKFATRAAILSLLAWIAYTVNTQLEASIFSTYATGFWFAIVSALFSCGFCGAAVAFLFPSENQGDDFVVGFKEFFVRHSAASWVWRLAVAAIAFAPIYFFFGLLVTPFTLDYYRQNMFGLELPTIEQILPILFLRSWLFLFACLPVIVLWQKSARSLFLRLGFALYILVGFVYMLISTFLPLSVRFPHALEILADEFVYAGVLVLLLARRDVSES